MAHGNTGNNYWTMRKRHGRKMAFESSEALWNKCVEYFEWIEANPLKESKLVSYQGESKLQEVPRMRAMTIEGLCLFIGITRETWIQYRSKPNGFSEIVSDVDEIIREQKFTGAAADLLNANIISRDLNLMESHSHEISGKNGDPIRTEDVSAESAARRIAFILAKAVKEKDSASDKEG